MHFLKDNATKSGIQLYLGFQGESLGTRGSGLFATGIAGEQVD
jgi:hypothetical protein